MISWLGIDVAKSSLAVWLRPQGLAPYNNDSGNFQGKRKICGGCSAVRRVLLVRLNAMLRDGTACRTSLTGQDSG